MRDIAEEIRQATEVSQEYLRLSDDAWHRGDAIRATRFFRYSVIASSHAAELRRSADDYGNEWAAS